MRLLRGRVAVVDERVGQSNVQQRHEDAVFSGMRGRVMVTPPPSCTLIRSGDACGPTIVARPFHSADKIRCRISTRWCSRVAR